MKEQKLNFNEKIQHYFTIVVNVDKDLNYK